MLSVNFTVPSFWLSPAARKKVDQARLHTDIVGLGLAYTIGSLIPSSFQWILSIYTIMAWTTILTIDPTRLPDAAATKISQKRAWKYMGLSIPLYAFVLGILYFSTGTPEPFHTITLATGISLFINACLIELYYRNILQAKLRQLGLSVIAAVGLQSLGFSLHFYVSSHSLQIAASSFILGIVNGMIVYKTRSIYPNFLVTFVWFFLFS